MTPAPRYRPARIGACLRATCEELAGGSLVLRPTETLEAFPVRLADRLEDWALAVPERVFAARRGADDAWREITYAAMLQRARALGQALLEHGLSAQRPLVILSDNDLEHLSLIMGALWAGIPSVSVSAAYSLVSADHGRLRHILDKTTPGLVFASDARFGPAILATVAGDVPVALGSGGIAGREVLPFETLLATRPGALVDAAHAATGPDTVARLMFTSGSTSQPKGVMLTNRMWCANQQMVRQTFAFLQDEPPVLVDWLPWNHVFGGTHNLGLVLYNGGTLYIDDGRPTPQGLATTLRNLREIAPTFYFNVPKGYADLVAAMRDDEAVRRSLFSRLKAIHCGGAGLSQPTWDALEALSDATVGERIQIFTGMGMTEASPACTFVVAGERRAGWIGLPCPGVEAKLVPVGAKLELRFRGPNIMPGYWREPALNAQAFDDEGFYRTGDAAVLVDPARPADGLAFDGRIAEDFKLSSGTFVSVGALRARALVAGDRFVQDVVVTGLDRDEIGLLVFPRLAACAALAGLPDAATAGDVLAHPEVVEVFQRLLDRLWQEGTGSATRVARLHVLETPPAVDRGEITDKGSINQKAVLQHRAALVHELHTAPPGHPSIRHPRRHQDSFPGNPT
jgi:feruloyl-CoA synthase